jgi:hypothetical protein
LLHELRRTATPGPDQRVVLMRRLQRAVPIITVIGIGVAL